MSEAPRVQLYLQDRLLAEVPFEGDALRIGRMKENDLVVNNLAVSRFHAVLRRNGASLEIEDLGSENGTFVAGQRVRGVTPFAADQAVGVGQHLIVVRAAAGVVAACEEAEVIDDVTVVDESFADFPTATATAATETVTGVAPPLPPDVAPGTTGESDSAPRAVDAGEGAHEALEMPFASDEMDHAVAEAELLAERPAVTESPDPTGAFDFGEEDIPFDEDIDLVGMDVEGADVGDALADPLTDSLTDPTGIVSIPGAPSGEHTALFDFGLNEDLASSDPGAPALLAQPEDAAPVLTPIETPPEIDIDALVDSSDDDEDLLPVAAVAMGERPEDDDAVLVPADSPVAGELLTEELPAKDPAEEHAGLIVQRGGQLERVVAWSGETMMAGRGKDCDVPLPDADVSRRHASFERTATGYRVVDQGSINGIRVNGDRRDVHDLEVGDVIGIGDFELTFVIDRQPVGEGIRLPEPPERVDVDIREQTMLAGWDDGGDPLSAAAPAPTRVDLIDEPEEDDDKDRECSVAFAAAHAGAAASTEAAPVRLEISVPADRLPEALRAALAKLEEDEIVVPAEVHFRIR
jgi:pSer/pThr/pTyr-binding forkhead associated (FHA) protein